MEQQEQAKAALVIPRHREDAALPQPLPEYLGITELAVWLVLDIKTVRRMIAAGELPAGKVRPGKRSPSWTRHTAAIAKWIGDHTELFQGEKPRNRAGE